MQTHSLVSVEVSARDETIPVAQGQSLEKSVCGERSPDSRSEKMSLSCLVLSTASLENANASRPQVYLRDRLADSWSELIGVGRSSCGFFRHGPPQPPDSHSHRTRPPETARSSQHPQPISNYDVTMFNRTKRSVKLDGDQGASFGVSNRPNLRLASLLSPATIHNLVTPSPNLPLQYPRIQ